VVEDKACRALAYKLANDLFTNGFGEVARRLVLFDSSGDTIGSWTEQAVSSAIYTRLMLEKKELSRKKASSSRRRSRV